MTGVVLFALSLAWAWSHELAAQARERDQLVRFTDSLARSLEPIAAQAPDDASLAAQVRGALRLQRPLRVVTLKRVQDVIVEVGQAPEDEALVVVHRPMGIASGDESRRLSAPWSWERGPRGAMDRDLELVARFDPGLNPGARRDTWARLALGLSVAWAAIAALVVAWRRRLREQELQRTLEHERRERERLSELSVAAAGLAHETKNPLGLILGVAQRLYAAPDAGPVAREAAEQIMDAADRAAARLGDFLHFARIPTPRLAPVDARALLLRLVTTLEPDFAVAGVDLRVELEPLTVRCDEGMLEQVVVNLLLNSLQASPRGTHVTVRLARAGPTATLSVLDEGHGIADALLPSVFKPYVTGRPDGHGLGLAIVKRIVEQHRWSIALERRAQGGTAAQVTGLEVLA